MQEWADAEGNLRPEVARAVHARRPQEEPPEGEGLASRLVTAFVVGLCVFVAILVILALFRDGGQVHETLAAEFPARVLYFDTSAHAGPSFESPLLFRLECGDRVKADKAQDGWLRVSTPDGKTGWVFAGSVAGEETPWRGRGFVIEAIRFQDGGKIRKLSPGEIVVIEKTRGDSQLLLILSDGTRVEVERSSIVLVGEAK